MAQPADMTIEVLNQQIRSSVIGALQQSFRSSLRQVVLRGIIGDIPSTQYRTCYTVALRDGNQVVYLDVGHRSPKPVYGPFPPIVAKTASPRLLADNVCRIACAHVRAKTDLATRFHVTMSGCISSSILVMQTGEYRLGDHPSD